MPSGRVHSAVTMLAAVALSCHDPVMGLGAASGVIISPDLDVDTGFVGFGKLRNIPIVGRPLAFIWEWFWKPCSIFFAHRSISSHGLIISTAIRVCYLAIPFFIANIWIPMTIPAWLGRAIVGLLIVDCLHILMDALSTGKRV